MCAHPTNLDAPRAPRLEREPDYRTMECINCMSREARCLRAQGWQWVVAPLFAPVMCNRCLTSYYYPRPLLAVRRLIHWCQRWRAN